MNLPAPGYISNASRTTAEQKTAFEDQRNFIAALLGGAVEGALTISAGAIMPGGEDSSRAKAAYAVDTEGLAATDDLANIQTNNCHSGMFLMIRCANDARAVVVKHGAGGGGEISTANGLDYALRTVRQWMLLQLVGTQWLERDRGPAISSGRWEVQGLLGNNNAGTPNTQWDMSADTVTLRSPADTSTVTRVNTGTLTNNLSTAGPAANGRDQSGAFSASSWVHFYFIWNGTTLSTISSAVAPPTGPTLPTGYTHWAYATSVRFNATSQMVNVRARGAEVYPTNAFGVTQVLTAGSATSATAVSVASVVPPNALNYTIFDIGWAGITDGSGNLAMELVIQILTGVPYAHLVRAATTGNANSASTRTQVGGPIRLPNVGQQFFYAWTVTNGSSPSANIGVASYRVPNGDGG